MRVLQFGRNKALLIWVTNRLRKKETRCKINFATVHLTSYRTSEIFTVHLESSDFEAVTFPVWTYGDDTFDIIYPNGREKSCGDEPVACKVTVDAEGNKVAGPVPWFDKNLTYMTWSNIESFPLVAQTRSKGYLLLDHNSTHIDAALVPKDGE